MRRARHFTALFRTLSVVYLAMRATRRHLLSEPDDAFLEMGNYVAKVAPVTSSASEHHDAQTGSNVVTPNPPRTRKAGAETGVHQPPPSLRFEKTARFGQGTARRLQRRLADNALSVSDERGFEAQLLEDVLECRTYPFLPAVEKLSSAQRERGIVRLFAR